MRRCKRLCQHTVCARDTADAGTHCHCRSRGAIGLAGREALKQPTWCRLQPDGFDTLAARVARGRPENLLFIAKAAPAAAGPGGSRGGTGKGGGGGKGGGKGSGRKGSGGRAGGGGPQAAAADSAGGPEGQLGPRDRSPGMSGR